jgi:hypothetical protein
MPQALDLATLKQTVAGTAAAFRCVTELRAAGGAGSAVGSGAGARGGGARELRTHACGRLGMKGILADGQEWTGASARSFKRTRP